MSRFILGSRAALVAALDEQAAALGSSGAPDAAVASWLAERRREVAEELSLDALFLVVQFPGGQIPEAEKCCYAYDLRACAGLCAAAWAEEAFWSGLVRTRAGPAQRTRLMAAAWRGDADRLRWLLERGASIDAPDAAGETALHYAALAGREAAARALCEAGARVDARGMDGDTPLTNASEGGHVDVVRLLLTAGADANAATADGTTPIFLTAAFGRTEVARALLDAGADATTHRMYGRWSWYQHLHSPLYVAINKGHYDVARIILAAATPSADDLGNALREAIRNNAVSFAETMLDAGARLGNPGPHYAGSFAMRESERTPSGSASAAYLARASHLKTLTPPPPSVLKAHGIAAEG
jgi:ankyrin repeat protein